jgi:hypothetical protein
MKYQITFQQEDGEHTTVIAANTKNDLIDVLVTFIEGTAGYFAVEMSL